MKLRISYFLMAFIALALLTNTGCSKKTKPNAGMLDAGAIQAKDMDFTAQGSDSGKIDGLYTVHFDYDKSSLTQETRDLLVKDAEWIKKHPKMSVQIEGHCDRHGSAEYNLALGERRAKSVQKYLHTLGVASNRMSVISYGKEKMLDEAETDAADAKNRRANFKPVSSPTVNSVSQR